MTLRRCKNWGERHVVEAICLAKDVKANLVILDDKKARKLAEKEGLKVAGLLALLIMAKEKGFIKRVNPLIDDLKRNSFLYWRRYICRNTETYWRDLQVMNTIVENQLPILSSQFKEPLPLDGMQYVGFGKPLTKEQLNKLAQPLFKKAIHQ